MLKKIKTLVLAISLLFVPAASLAVVGVASAQQPNANIQGNLCRGANQLTLTPSQQAACADETRETAACDFNCTLRKIVNLISIIVGVVAVIMIIIGGFRYIISGGSAEKVTAAKNTILYGIVGLVIVALAQVIVRFVLRETTQTGP